MISQDLANKLSISLQHTTQLTLHSFEDQQPLWQKGKQSFISPHAIQSAKRYPFFKFGKILGMETNRHLALYQKYLFYFEEEQSGIVKGFCNLDYRYVQWHKTTTGKYLLLVSNTIQTSILYFDTPNFWNDHKEEINKYAIRTNFQKQYSILQLLGQGSFSSVFLIRNKNNGKKYAAKKIGKYDKNNKSTKKLIIEQRKILNQLSHCCHASSLIQFYQENDEYILILEYIQGKDLLGFIKDTPNLSLDTIKIILTSILVCLKSLHYQRIIHRDIKPHNILIDSHLHCKLIDFGLSLDTKNPPQKNQFRKCGTVGYMAPEVFINQFSYMKPYNHKCDMFSFGIIAHMLLLGNNPIKGKNYQESCELNRQCKILLNQQKITEKYGWECYNFLHKLLETNAKYRFSAEQALNSKFLQEIHDKDEKLSVSTLDQKRKLSEESLLK